MIESTETRTQTTPLKQRHGCLTALLVFMLIANSASILITSVTFLGFAGTPRTIPDAPPAWAILVFIVMGVFNVACVIALWRWKKWGFWGFAGVAVAAFLINLSIGLGLASVVGLGGIALLYGVLHIGKERKGWPQLE